MSRAADIAAYGVAKRFGHVEALVDATIEVAPGEGVALVGDNRTGKTPSIERPAAAFEAAFNTSHREVST